MATRAEVKPRPNLLGAGGWFWGGNYKIERYMYIVHRVTGLGIILFGFFHLIETTFFRSQGQSVWEMTMQFLENPIFEVGLILVSLAFVIHALNGLRLILMELGFLLGKPKRPVFPYQDALRKKRAYTLIVIAVVVILLIVFLLNRVLGGG
jgi:succinate dehydrogenase / fumarate reductase, cytochrome b subunit